MKVLESFEFKGKIYEIRMIESADRITVRAYHQNKAANAFSHNIDNETNQDFIRTHGKDALQLLIQHAKSDITDI